MDSPQQPLISNGGNKIYVTRWYVLCMVSLLTCVQNVVWSGWGAIAQSAKAVYLWTDSTVDMLVNAGNIATLVLIIPASWLLDVRGLRKSVVIASVVIAIGTGLRCITYEPTTATWLIFIGQTLNGVGGTVTFAAPPLLSETWFPFNERTTATAIGIVFSVIGGALSSVLGPQIVSEPFTCKGNLTNSTMKTNSTCNGTSLEAIRQEIMILNYADFGVAALLALMILVYFPDKPASPPSLSAQQQRMTFTSGLKLISRLIPFWHVALAFALPLGVMGVWSSTLDVTLAHFNISQKTAGWLSFYGSLGGVIVGIILSRFADIFKKRLKVFLILAFMISAVMYILFVLILGKYISGSKAMIYVTYIGGSTLVMGSMPLFYEMACETAHPAAEGVISGCMTFVLNLSGSVVLLFSLIPDIGTGWMNWSMIAAVSLAVLLLMSFKVRYTRMDIDLQRDEEIVVNKK